MLICIKKYLEIQHVSGSYTEPTMLFFLLINVKMPIIVGILTFFSMKKITTSGPAYQVIIAHHVVMGYFWKYGLNLLLTLKAPNKNCSRRLFVFSTFIFQRK